MYNTCLVFKRDLTGIDQFADTSVSQVYLSHSTGNVNTSPFHFTIKKQLNKKNMCKES